MLYFSLFNVLCGCLLLYLVITELIENKPYNKSVDVYAFGVLMWEVLSGEIPFYMIDINELRQRVISGVRPRIPSYGFTPKLVQLIQDCWFVTSKILMTSMILMISTYPISCFFVFLFHSQ